MNRTRTYLSAAATGILALTGISVAQDCEWVWTPIGASDWVYAMLVFDDGSGPAVYAGGRFGTIGGVFSPFLARYNGRDWEPVGGGGLNGHVGAMTIHDDGSGPALIVGGAFTTAGGVEVPHVAKWDGKNWTPVGDGLLIGGRTLYAFASVPGPDGNTLYAGGGFRYAGKNNFKVVRGAAELRDNEWIDMAGGHNATIRSMAAFDDGSGPALYVAGGFDEIGGKSITGVAKWTGNEWVGWNFQGPKGYSAGHLWIDPYPGGPVLCASGGWDSIGGQPVDSPACWDGQSWFAMSEGINISVYSTAFWGDGPDRTLYIGGHFTHIGDKLAHNMAIWRDGEFSPVLPGCDYYIRGMAAHDFDGNGPTIFVGGQYEYAGGLYSPNMAMLRCIPMCPADCDASGALDLADFACFQSAFAAGDAAADCDASGSLDLFDYLCFVNSFNEGCP